MDIIWYMFDMIGTIAFAVSGALVGVSRKMDIFAPGCALDIPKKL